MTWSCGYAPFNCRNNGSCKLSVQPGQVLVSKSDVACPQAAASLAEVATTASHCRFSAFSLSTTHPVRGTLVLPVGIAVHAAGSHRRNFDTKPGI
jgi:hypothetical protein